jgi:saccharopine dehydrogenase-like NADP-dependent oxidoreductase
MSKPNLLILGAGGVGAVCAHKAAQNRDAFGTMVLASRTLVKASDICADANARWAGGDSAITARAVDARDAAQLAALIRETGTGLVVNVATPYCNEATLAACLETGAAYLDTAVAEREFVENMKAPWYSHVEWPLMPKFRDAGIDGVLGIGFDPGVVNVFCAYAKKHLFDSVDTIDIIDVNGGDHGRYFATNFDPDTNLREIKEDVLYWENGDYVRIPHHSKRMDVTLPLVGDHTVYSMGHDELHSLPLAFPEAKRIEFWMGFGERYLTVFNVLNELGLTSSVPVTVDGVDVAPVRVVKALLPDPSSLAAGYTGSVCIGCDIRGTKDGERRRVFVYSTCDHAACYEEVGSQAISYTTGVPAMTAALLLADGTWSPGGLVHCETPDPDPFLARMPKLGIDWAVMDLPVDGGWPEA